MISRRSFGIGSMASASALAAGNAALAANLNLSVAVGDYDRIRPLVDGAVRIDGVDPAFMLLEPEEIFFRAFRQAEFDICELSLSSFTVQTGAGTSPYVGIPVFPSRAFRHTALCIRTDRGIASPADLKGKRIGLPEYQLTAHVWVRAILEEEYGVKPSDIIWVRGGLEQAGRLEKLSITLPADVKLEAAPEDATLSQMLERGDLDGILAPRAPSCFERGYDKVGWLWPDPRAASMEWYKKTRIFPIMHVLGVRRTLVEQHKWLPAALLKAFERSKTVALDKLGDTSATKVTLPFVEESLRGARDLMGKDFWSYGFANNKHVLEFFLKHHYRQGLSKRLLKPEELFHPASLETFRI